MLNRLQLWSAHPLAVASILLWSLAEATVFPMAPDLLLIFSGLGRPRRWLAYGLVALVGSLLGGMITYLAAVHGGTLPGESALLVTPRMEQAALQRLSHEGASALLTQPFGGVPYKVYAALAPSAGIGVGEFLSASAVGRGTRLLLVVGLSAWARRRFGMLIELHFGWVALGILVGFFVLLGLVLMVWA